MNNNINLTILPASKGGLLLLLKDVPIKGITTSILASSVNCLFRQLYYNRLQCNDRTSTNFLQLEVFTYRNIAPLKNITN